jgi:5,10-methylene-tetrahydrofolate dehydrogenase/methenyl tetrahydrofolate cyclohydrolase
MPAHIIDGNLLSKELRTQVAERVANLTQQGRQPGLAVILVGDSQASQVYVRNKIKACEDVGIHSVFEKYDATFSEADLLARVEALNHDPRIHGILVQLPLPAHIDSHKVIEAIAADSNILVDRLTRFTDPGVGADLDAYAAADETVIADGQVIDLLCNDQVMIVWKRCILTA